ncbi:hypothetical protein LCGC14_1115850 [marine sediment metagenome]|uniref:Uncharacterized protein n=1 Tax=marine sediment metagenome TaxID=412755 RepID=A0A0F9M5C0_9ZZZZ
MDLKKTLKKWNDKRKNSQDKKEKTLLIKSVSPQTLTISVKRSKNYNTVEAFLSVKLPQEIITSKIRRIYRHYYNSLSWEVNQAINKVNSPQDPDNKNMPEGIDFE